MKKKKTPLRSTRAPRPATARWRTRQPGPRPRVVIVGFGRVGSALAIRLKEVGWVVSALPRSAASVKKAVQLGIPLAGHDELEQAALCILAVPDSAVAGTAASVLDDLGKNTALIHCAGALELSAFGDSPEILKRVRGSFHPLVAISDHRDALEGHTVALAASDRSLMPVLWRMALALRLKPLEVPEARRAAYHAGAVLSAGLAVALLDAAVAAFQEAGLDRDAALNALLPLMKSALNGAEKRGLARALTGPIPRGDVSVVKAHLSALPPALSGLYRLLSQRALTLVGSSIPDETRLALERALSP